MKSRRYMVDFSLTNESLNPLLPQVVGAIEDLDEATFSEIKKHAETDLNKKISNTVLERALDNGMKLGIVKMRREFKVCKEFTTREIKRLKYVEENLWSENKAQMLGPSDDKKKTLWDFVQYHRDQRRKKLTLKRKKHQTNMNNGWNLESEQSDYLCTKCRKSIERNETKRSRSSHSHHRNDVWDEEDSRSSECSETESDVASSVTKKSLRKSVGKKVSGKKETQDKRSDEKSQGKSRLLVEKNPLETEPPYYDIFT